MTEHCSVCNESRGLAPLYIPEDGKGPPVSVATPAAKARSAGESTHRRELGTLVRWYVGTLVRWYVGTLVRWYVGTLVRWYVGSLVCSIVR